MAQSGYVFDIQRYAIHDGPGIRTIAFLKGCPLSCLWCQNPESNLLKPQLLFRAESCVACGACVEACPKGAVRLEGGLARTDRSVCDACGDCVAACPEEARSVAGRLMGAEEVCAELAKDSMFYEGSGGGATLSGGEVLAQPEFAREILRLCRERGIHTAIETSGFAPWETMRSVAEYADLVLYDVKHMDSAAHKAGTGVPNELALSNLVRLKREMGKALTVRVPVIPGYNDGEANLEATAEFTARELGPGAEACLLPYHRLGVGKRLQMEEDGGFSAEPPDSEFMQRALAIFVAKGLAARIGG